jgi:hypothetical protein
MHFILQSTSPCQNGPLALVDVPKMHLHLKPHESRVSFPPTSFMHRSGQSLL